ncbi:Zinc finger CCCH domain-containing protein 17 [Linum perenne]
METGSGVLYAASQDGVIVAWRVVDSDKAISFQPPVYLKGHKCAVICLRYGAGKLYSGSMDRTINKCDNKTLECLQTFKGHDDDVMSLLCFDTHLLSCSLDQKIKVWATSEKRNLEMVYTHEDEDYGALALC